MVNSMQARLRAQLGDKTEYSGERRRRSVVVASIVLTITDPLRGSYPLWCYLQAALIRLHGVNHNQPFPTATSLQKIFTSSTILQFFSAFEVSRPYHAKSFERFDSTSFQEIFYYQGFFAVKRRAVFILGAKWTALVRGWRRDCVVGGMETRFQ